MNTIAYFASMVYRCLLLGISLMPVLSHASLLPREGFPIGRADLVETRTVKELRPGLTHVHVERGAWPEEGPPKYALMKPGEQDSAEFRANMERAGHAVREHLVSWNGGVTPQPLLIAGEFNTVEEARWAARKMSFTGDVSSPAKLPGWDAGPFVLDIVVLDPKVYRGKVVSAWSGKAWRESPLELARKHNAVVAVNGSWFEYSMGEIAGVPTGLSIVQGEWHHETNTRMMGLYIENKKNGEIALSISATPPPFPEFKYAGGKSVVLDGIDRMPGDNELVAMRPAIVDTSPLSHATPSHILMRQIGGDGYLARHIGWREYLRPPSGLVLMATGDKQAILKEAMESGQPVELDLRVPGRPGLNAWYTAHPLVQDGKPAQGLTTYPLSHTVVGTDAEGRIYVISVDGSDPDTVHLGGPIGVSDHDLVAVSQYLGLVNSANLDGGGRSVSMVIDGKVLSYDNDIYLTTEYDDDRRVGDAVLIIDAE